MICPNCGREMEEGCLYTPNSTPYWTKRPRGPFSFPAFQKDAVILRSPAFLAQGHPASLCRTCRVAVFQYR